MRDFLEGLYFSAPRLIQEKAKEKEKDTGEKERGREETAPLGAYGFRILNSLSSAAL